MDKKKKKRGSDNILGHFLKINFTRLMKLKIF